MILGKGGAEKARMFQCGHESSGIAFRDRGILKIPPVFGRKLFADRLQRTENFRVLAVADHDLNAVTRSWIIASPVSIGPGHVENMLADKILDHVWRDRRVARHARVAPFALDIHQRVQRINAKGREA